MFLLSLLKSFSIVKMSLKQKLKQIGLLRFLYNYYALIISTHFRFRLLRFFKGNLWVWKDYLRYRVMQKNNAFKLNLADAMFLIEDKTSAHSIEPIYFFQ